MKLSFSTNAFTKYPVTEAVEKIASIGYEGVEILADVPHLYMSGVSNSEINALKETINRSGIRVSNINANTVRGYNGNTRVWDPLFEPSLASVDAAARKWRINYSRKCISLAEKLGCPNVSLNSGYIMPETTPEQAMELLKGSLKELLRYAEDRDIRIGLEYEPGLLIEYCAELAGLIKELASPYLGANLDLGHSFVVGEDPETVLKALDGKIFHVHLEDIKDKKHFHLIPGLGDMDFGSLLELHKKYSYKGFVTVELYTYSDEPERAAGQAFEYLNAFDVWAVEKTRR
ncbi:MAG: sugar phosphate isomerase/epimerase [Deltaproteobacteria bacterium]|nr:sugar phosphate isomerase/epimerase [Deltaproteobacteria bacterium]